MLKRLLPSIILTFCLSLLSVPLYSQKAMQYYAAAEKAYNMGRFEEAKAILDANIAEFRDDERVGAYRLLTLCCLNMDKADEAQGYAESLVAVSPFYTEYDGNPRFADLIEQIKSGATATITTASRQAESLKEAPVPVTLITEEMIRMSGAQTLRELLCLFVPNMTRVEGMEANVCMRGIVGSNQEDILIMIDGHRLNSRATNSESPDFRNSLDKIKQIEVLRGPASSLYGNVALMAVVNIITKSGTELSGSNVALRTGMFGTLGLNAMHGNGNYMTDYLIWGNIYKSTGQKIMYDERLHYIDGYRDRPSFDLGAKLRWKDFSILATGQHSKLVPFFNQFAVAPYTYDLYSATNGSGPGQSRLSTNLAMNFQHTWGDFSLHASLEGAYEKVHIFNCVGDSLSPEVANGLLEMLGIHDTSSGLGLYEALQWDDYSAGINVNGDYSYTLGRGHGSLLLGAQFELFNMTSSKFELAGHYKYIAHTMSDIIKLDSETTSSAYMQLKHSFNPHLIFNGGIRFDSKHRYNGTTLNSFSPRLALIWIPTQVISTKFCYAHSFVDAPYVYRANSLPMYTGGSDLSHQINDAMQLSTMFEWKPLHLKCELNFFGNKVRNLVIYSIASLGEGGLPFTTASVDIGGIEAVTEYSTQSTFINLNMSYKYAFKMKGYSNFDHKVGNEPYYAMNLVAGRRIVKSERAGNFWLRANMHFQTSAEMEVNSLYAKLQGQENAASNEHCPPQTMFNVGMDWKWKMLSVSFDVYNLFNYKYRIGSQLQSWMPSRGTQVMGKVSIDF